MNKKTLLLAILLLGSVVCTAQVRPAIRPDAKIEAAVEKTLSRMTLDEKIGQMLELNLDVMGAYDPANPGAGWILNETMLDT